MEDKIVFEDYGIEFSNEDFEGVDNETLNKCKKMLENTLNKIENQ